LVFPEGTSTRDGKPQQFNPGIFKLCAEYNIPIIPITLVYDKNIGLNKEDNINYRDWMNNTITTIIHP
jgi:1-acyl-sn-glycerol-3-phosphate acyltransferase